MRTVGRWGFLALFVALGVSAAFAARGPVGGGRELGVEHDRLVCDSDSAADDARLVACNALIAGEDADAEDLSADYVSRGNIRFRAGAFGDAAADYGHAIALTPNIGAPYYNRGTAYAGACRLSDAVTDFTTALRFAPDQPAVLLARASAYSRLKQHDAAMADIARYLTQAPNDAAGLSALGVIEANRGRFGDAIDAYGRALAVTPDYADALYNRALAYAHAGRMAEGRGDIERFIVLRPEMGRGYSARASLFESGEAARADLAKAAALDAKSGTPQTVCAD